MNKTLSDLCIAVLPLLGVALGYLVKAKMIASKTKASELENADMVIAMWRELVAEKEKQNGLLHQKEVSQEQKIERLEACKLWLEGELKTVLAENNRLREEVLELKKSEDLKN